MNEEVHKVLHEGVVERVTKLEEAVELINRPEDGTLAKMKISDEALVEKLESKLNYLVIFLLTTVVGALATIVLAKLGYK